MEGLYYSNLESLPLLMRGKVRDIYEVDDDHILIVTTDRISVFDVILPTPIPGKGKILSRMSMFWMERLAGIIDNHLAAVGLNDVIASESDRKQTLGRSVVVRRFDPLPIEAIVRGYLAGSGWSDYRKTGTLQGQVLPAGLRLADKLPAAVFAPSTKAAPGDHDENISFARMCELTGPDVASRVRDVSLRLYHEAAEFALGRGIIIADTKFEFGLDPAGKLVLIDEALTPDSSRFWPVGEYVPGTNPPSFDKQFVRDYVREIGWKESSPPPELPPAIVEKTADKYREAMARLGAATNAFEGEDS